MRRRPPAAGTDGAGPAARGTDGCAVEQHLERIAELEEEDRRNGTSRHLLTALGDIELWVQRSRRFSAGAVLRAYARREAEIDRMIPACFVLGLSTRKVGEALLPLRWPAFMPGPWPAAAARSCSMASRRTGAGSQSAAEWGAFSPIFTAAASPAGVLR